MQICLLEGFVLRPLTYMLRESKRGLVGFGVLVE